MEEAATRVMQVSETTRKAHPDGALEEARMDLELARQWFDWVTEPLLVDEAIYRLRAAEMRLTDLTRSRRARGPGGDPSAARMSARAEAVAR